MMLETKRRYGNSKEIVGSALFKIERDYNISLTNSNDSNLQRIYEIHKQKADGLAEKLWKLNNEEFDLFWTHITAIVLSGSFELTFGQLYGRWRKSFANTLPSEDLV